MDFLTLVALAVLAVLIVMFYRAWRSDGDETDEFVYPGGGPKTPDYDETLDPGPRE